MTRLTAWLCVGALAWTACSSSGTGDMTSNTVSPTGATPPAATASAAGSGKPALPVTTSPAAVGGAGASATPAVGQSGLAGSSAQPASAGAPPSAAAAAGTSAATAGAGAVVATAGTAAGPAAAGSGGAATAPAGMFATEPVIPEVSGECPTFRSGTATVMGLSGIALQVGTKKEGAPTGPLVFYWHGTGSSSFEVSNFAGASEVTQQGGIVVAFSGSKGTGGDCSGTGTFALDDFKVVDQITACAVKEHNIDPKRIYATGCSAGGLMTGCMGIQRSNYVAAVAPNSGGITIGYGKVQDPTRMPAVLTMHGSAADMVIVTFSETSEAYDNYMQEKGSFVVNCNHGGGHCGAPASLEQSAWQFMKDHPFGTRPSPYANGLPSGFHQSCKIWQKTARRPLGEGMGMRTTP